MREIEKVAFEKFAWAIVVALQHEAEGTEKQIQTHNAALEAAAICGWDWEEDEELVDFCLEECAAGCLAASVASFARFIHGGSTGSSSLEGWPQNIIGDHKGA